MRVLGICRFSYPALGGFKRMHDSIEDREAYLYAPDRMELRFRHFETLTLPSIAAQRDPDFTFLVLIGESLPKPYLDRLHDLTAAVPQIRIVARPPMKHRLAMQLVLQEELAGVETESIQFRLDDDDAVGIHFIRALRRTARRSTRMREGWRNMAIEYRSGYSARLSADGISARPVQAPFWACGLAVLFRPGDPKTVMNYAHHKLHEVMPTLIEPSTPMFIRALHDDNDSGANDTRLKPLTEAESADLKARFNVDEAQVKTVFSGQSALRDKA
ncbi:Putative rhamnosyl transferase [Roseovarius litoreus]|uniref:Rhamnosyl transferase n=1 Tax=Roseovarius litoreus TaxID=1155722 RepID=A0A1M6ZDC2_9RHOB|nr:putative rhamnosyl transferase [Roseovarius litoreus]SHL28349.1 Putative rhamnosyl transferase [Roseovarius litoreus]